MISTSYRRLVNWLLLALFLFIAFSCEGLVEYDRKPPKEAFEVGLKAEDLMFDIKDVLSLDRQSAREFSSVDNYCTLPFPDTWNPFVDANQMWRDINKNPRKGFRANAGLDIDVEALGEQRDLDSLFDETRRWLGRNDFTIEHDGRVSNEGWEIRALSVAERMRFEAWGRDQRFEIKILAACIEAQRR